MTYRTEQHRRQANFEKTMMILRGDVPHVRSLAILAALQPPGVPLGNRDEWQQRIKQTLTLAQFVPIHVRCALVDKLIVPEFAESFILPHLIRFPGLHYGQQFGQRAIIFGQQRDHSDSTFQFDLYERELAQQDFSKTRTKCLSLQRRLVLNADADFYIPFFDDLMAGLTPECELDGDVSFVEAELPKIQRVKEIIEKIRAKEEFLNGEQYTGKAQWSSRGGINLLFKEFKSLGVR